MKRMLRIAFLLCAPMLGGCDYFKFNNSPSAPPSSTGQAAKPPRTSFVIPVKYIFAKLAWTVSNELEAGTDPVTAASKSVGKMTKAVLNVLVPEHANYSEEDLIKCLCNGGNGKGELSMPERIPVLIIINKKIEEVSYIQITKDILSLEATSEAGMKKVKIENADGDRPLRVWLFCDDELGVKLKFVMRSTDG